MGSMLRRQGFAFQDQFLATPIERPRLQPRERGCCAYETEDLIQQRNEREIRQEIFTKDHCLYLHCVLSIFQRECIKQYDFRT